MKALISVLATVIFAFCVPRAANAATVDWAKVSGALGKQGTEMPGGIYRVGLPRNDLHATLDGIELKPAFALGSWLAFAPAGDRTMVMGDLVLTASEVAPVMHALVDGNIEVTALHNHLLRAQPMTFYLHVFGEGDAVELARSLHKALALSKTPLGVSPSGAQPKLDLDTSAIDKKFGVAGKSVGGVYQVGIPRAEAPREHGVTLLPPMGVAEAINFEPLGGGKAAITGDFVLTAAEVNPVLRTLRENQIEVTALHSHMLEEEPRLFFVHFWAHDDLDKLLTGLHAALQHIAVAKS